MSTPPARASSTADAVGPQAFDESQLQSHWGYEAMKRCLDYGWMTLTDTGEWKPNAYVTRAEFAADLARFAGIHVFYPTDGAAQFSDVDPASDLAPYIAWASDSGIVTGFDDGTFRFFDNLVHCSRNCAHFDWPGFD